MTDGMAGHSEHVLHSDDVSASRLIEKYTPLVRKVARQLGFMQEHHYHNGMEVEDAMQAGYIGLWKASKTYDSKRAVNFIAYAFTKIKMEILDELRRNQWTRGSRHHETIRIQHMGFGDPKVFKRHAPDSESQVADMEWCERIDSAVNEMDFKRRNIYQGVMRNDDAWSKKRMGETQHESLGIHSSRVSQLRQDIRKKLKKALH